MYINTFIFKKENIRILMLILNLFPKTFEYRKILDNFIFDNCYVPIQNCKFSLRSTASIASLTKNFFDGFKTFFLKSN